MARETGKNSAVNAAAASLEPSMARAVARGLKKSLGVVNVSALAAALGRKDLKGAIDAVPAASLQTALAEAVRVTEKAVSRGARMGKDDIRKARR